ncbi:ABC-ATPase domain-containing protein [Anaerolineales bacterium HSG25]|nr:ABC-ATPase domain-containing protein [Anaerolineales bacterium HSG25]
MTQTITDLQILLNRLDGKGYPAYKDIRGRYLCGDFTLFIDHVQGDPYAAPSRFRVRLPMQIAKFPTSTRNSPTRLTALADFLARTFADKVRYISNSTINVGSGKSGIIRMPQPGQEILVRSSIIINAGYVEARFTVGLPAKGRRILGHRAAAILCRDIPQIVHATLHYDNLNLLDLNSYLNTAQDAEALRSQLDELGLVAFVVDGSILPRASGVDDRPLVGRKIVRFRSPERLQVEVTLPNAGRIVGMGIPKGVTLIVGGGYHGKSTLLSALERGVYNHIPHDGRELVVTEPSAVKIRAEDGRRIEGVDIRPFINDLPNRADASTFRTDNASGSTSQAANIIEALEVGAKLLLLDEDTCATNLLIRDARMQALVEKSGEPITPFVDRVRQLADTYHVSTILVLGGSGDYFDVADTVIRLDKYQPYEVTTHAKLVAERHPTGRQVEASPEWPTPSSVRIPIADSLDPRKGKREVNIKGRALRSVLFGREEIDLSLVSQLVDEGQVQAIGQALNYARQQVMDTDKTVAEIVSEVMAAVNKTGLDVLDNRQMGGYVLFRPYELAAALNRLRTLRVRHDS